MAQLTEHAKDILRALADGKQIEGRMIPGTWETVDNEYALCHISKGGSSFLRIKTETRSINGVEFAAPDRSGVYTFGGIFPQSWTRKEDRDTAYQAVVDALEGNTRK